MGDVISKTNPPTLPAFLPCFQRGIPKGVGFSGRQPGGAAALSLEKHPAPGMAGILPKPRG